MKIYLACSSKTPRVFREYQRQFAALGHTLTVDWLTNMERALETPEQAAITDRKGVRDADAVIFIDTGVHSPGGYWEVGFATGIRKPVGILVSPLTRIEPTCIFFLLDSYVQLESIKEADEWLKRLEVALEALDTKRARRVEAEAEYLQRLANLAEAGADWVATL